MVVEVPKSLLEQGIDKFEMLLGRAYSFLGLHPHEFPKDEHEALDALRALLIQLKSVAGLLGQDEVVVALEGAELIVEGAEVIADIVYKEDEEEEEIGHEPVVEDDSEEGDSSEGAESLVELDDAPVEEELIKGVVLDPIEEEEKLDEKVEAKSEKDEVQEEAGKESREKIKVLEAQLAALRKATGD